MRLLLILLFFSRSVCALGTEFSGNIEGRLRNATNNSEARKELLQDWKNENFALLYGNVNGKVTRENSKIEGNLFLRYSHSELYNYKTIPNYAPLIYTFPNQLVARDIFKLQHVDQNDHGKSEVILNKMFYELEVGNNRISFGRLYVNYGLGEIFNPINPFNQPTSLTSISQVAQGNDGFSFTYFATDKHSIQFLMLGDKRINKYDGEIEETFWINGEVEANEKIQLNYIIGKDQKRHKLGGQISYKFSEAMLFSQLLYQSHMDSDIDSNNLWDILVGYDEQLTNKWHLRIESGYQKVNRYLNLTSFERFLPTEYFMALANSYEIHPLVKLNGVLINDIKSGFVFFIAKSTFDIGNDSEAEVFIYSPLAKGDGAENAAQKLVTRDVGVALRKFF